MLRAVARQGTGPITKRVIDANAPAAGANFSLRVPGGKAWELLAVRCTFVASAEVANRIVTLVLNDAHGNADAAVQHTVAVTAGLTRAFSWALTGAGVVGADASILLPLPASWYMLPDETVGITVGAIDAGDQLSAVRVVVLETNTGDVYAGYEVARAMRDHLEGIIEYYQHGG